MYHEVRADATRSLWQQFTTPRGFRWITHRLQRDLLLETAQKEHSGWLNPPFAFFSELPERFGITTKPIGLLHRRRLISELTRTHAKRHAIKLPDGGNELARTNPIDSFLAEILPEAITAAHLAELLSNAAEDDFARRRNAWITDVYTAYCNELQQRSLYDPRAIHALIAERIDAGALQHAIDNHEQLHIYGLYTERSRRRLLQALNNQDEVGVFVYRLHETPPIEATVQPAPDAYTEAEWIASRVRQLIVEQHMAPHEIAVVARTGLEDTRRTMQLFRRAGIPATARVRSPLAEIGAVKALLVLFRAAAERWSYHNMRRVLTSPYFKAGVDVRTIDKIATESRPTSLAEWNLPADLQERLSQVEGERTTAQWIELIREVIEDGWLDFRRRICRPPLERNDVVRLDQRAVRQLEKLLREWQQVTQEDAPLSVADWYALLRNLLGGQELVLTTPGQKGVQILEAHDAALVPFRATFVMHANDGVFPRMPAPGGLFAEEERERLREAGLPVETWASATARETALWNAVTANDNVTITYRTTDGRGTPLLPSLLVPEHNTTNELARSNGTLSMTKHAVLQAHAEQLRRVKPLHAWNGVLRDPVVLQTVREKLGAGHSWSASQLELYGKNPFFYFIERILGLKTMEEADEETDMLTSGSVAHEILERFYSAVELPASVEHTTAVFGSAAHDVFAAREASGDWLGLDELWKQRKHWLCETLVNYVQWEVEKHWKNARPHECEHEIAIDLRGHDIHGNAVVMPFRGYVDRIDRLLKGGFQVVDYKTSSVPSPSGFRDGSVLQGVLYIEALRQEGLDAVCSTYRSLKKRAEGAKAKYGSEDYATALELAFSIPARACDGYFEANLACAQTWSSYMPDASVTRNRMQIREGHRFL